jgi:hypothetical protein
MKFWQAECFNWQVGTEKEISLIRCAVRNFLIEAAMIAMDLPAQIFRKICFPELEKL